MKIQHLINKFIGDIYFKDTVELKQDFIHICEAINQEYSIEPKNTEKLPKIMEELLTVFSTNDFIIMADYLQYELNKKIEL